MTFTKHGHYIPGTQKTEALGERETRPCGGVCSCNECIAEAAQVYMAEIEDREQLLHELPENEVTSRVIENFDPHVTAIALVQQYLNQNEHYVTIDEIFLVWFAYTLGNWKCLVSTTKFDGQYYEITHNVAKGETYLDAYVKAENVLYTNEELGLA